MTKTHLSIPQTMRDASAAYRAGDLAKTEQLCRAIVAAQPSHVDAHHLLAIVLSQTGRAEEALAGYDRALSLGPGNAMLFSNRGNILLKLKRDEEALASYEEALALDPGNPQTLFNHASALRALGRLPEALAVCDRVMAIRPDDADAHYNRGNVLMRLGRLPEAQASYRRALALAPKHRDAFGAMADCAGKLCDWREREAVERDMRRHVAEGRSIIYPFVLLAHCDDAALQLACARSYAQDRVPVPRERLWNGATWRNPKIKVAYLSGDFKQHPVSTLTAELFERHDRAAFEILGVSLGEDDGSPMRGRLAAAFDQFHDMRTQGDLEIARALHAQRVDILVDLSGYTQGSRRGILVRRPSPIQVNYLGYPATMGVDYVDYILADDIVAPFEAQPFYSEKIVHLPCFQANDSTRTLAERAPTRTEAGLPADGFVFCCFNNSWKITPALFDIWMRLLRAVERSVLWLSQVNEVATANLRSEAHVRGIDPARLIFAPKVERNEDHLARHRLADLFLDTLPYGAHATASDALWAGLPVLTCRGNAFAGRVAASLDRAVGLSELVTESLADYEALALRLATDTALLRGLRERFERNRKTHPLFDTDGFRRHIEAAYMRMWETWQRGEPPQSFAIAPQDRSEARAPAVGARAATTRAAAPRKTDTVEATLTRAVALHQAGKLDDALRLYREVLKAQPDQFDALHLSGVVTYQQGRHAPALELIASALRIKPDAPDAHSNQGLVLHAQGHHTQALASYERALALDPDHAGALTARGNTFQALGAMPEAVASYDRAIALKPNEAPALTNRGVALLALHRHEQALASHDAALALRPDYLAALVNRAGALIELQRYREAAEACDHALRIDEGYALAHYNRALALEKLKRYDEAIASCERAIKLDPAHRSTLGLLAQCCQQACDWARCGTLLEDIKQHVRERHSQIMPLVFLSYCDDAALQLACAQGHLAHLLPDPVTPLPRRALARRERIRIAYLSADFHRHATAYLMAELFERHDRARFEVFGISFGQPDASEMRARLTKAFDQFHDVRGASDREAAELIARLEVDIAVDLKGYTSEGRLGMLAPRPAPVQVSYLGFPGTLAADFIDYVLADPTVLPFDQQAFYTEKIVHLPDCYQVNDRQRRIADRTLPRAEAELPPQGFVFCCFNNSYKITAPVFDVWMRLLHAIEGSVLWLLRDNETAERNLREEAAARGVAPQRLVFARRRNLADHLARHRLADLFLDTLPYNAHTTASDALWAGLPVLTCLGQSFSGRVGASLLRAIGLGDLVTENLAAYEALALRLATEPALLRGLRERLAHNRLTQPLFDTDRFCRHIEAAYAQMWETCLRGEPPQSFAVRDGAAPHAT